MKYLISIVLILCTTSIHAYPWGERDTYLDGMPITKTTLSRCTWFYVQRNEAIIALKQDNISYPVWAYNSIKKSEFTDYITVFCGFSKIRITESGISYPKVGGAIFSNPINKRKWLNSHKGDKL